MRRHVTFDQGLLIALCLLATCWGLLGWLDLPKQAFAGFDTEGHHVVTRIYPGSPAESAGLQTGDRITHADGVALKSIGAMVRLPGKKAGESRRFTVERGEDSLDVEVTWATVSVETLVQSRVLLLVGLCFLFFPLLAFLRRPGDSTRLLVLAGFGLSLAIMQGPFISDFNMRSLAAVVTSLFTLLGMVAAVQFLLMFPSPRPWLKRAWAKPLLYGPVVLLWLLLVYRVFFTLATDSTLNTFTQFLSGVTTFAFLLSGLYLLLRNFSRTQTEERKVLGMNAMFIATVVAVLPLFIAQLVRVFSPQTPLPGQDYYFITLALLPMFWARTAMRHSSNP